jgi:SAM-dependent methyltransferase
MKILNPGRRLQEVKMPSTNHKPPRRKTGTKSKNPGSPFDDLAKEYDAWFDEEGSLIFSNEVKAFQPLLPYLPKTWLEIGVGSGRFAQALGINTGIDPSSKLVEIARSRGINAIIGRGEEQIFDAGSFGTVFLIVTLCFLDSPLKVLKGAYRILMPGGKLVLGLVLKESPWGKLYQQKKDEGHRFYKYARFYSCREVVRFMFKAGFMGDGMISTLTQRPGDVHFVEEPKEGYYPEAGFTILVGVKREKTSPRQRGDSNEM